MRADTAAVDFVEVQGAKIRYSLEGPADGPVLLFSNSLATSLEMWDSQVTAFASRYRILRYDTRGHGLSDASPPPYSLDRLADDALALLDALGIERATFVGISLGGMTGQVLAARHPDRLAALVLCDTAMRTNSQVWSDRIAAVEAEGLEPQVEAAIARWFTAPFRAAQPALMQSVRALIRQTSKEGYLGCAAAIRDMRLETLAPTIRVPTLVLVGDEDSSTPVAESQALQSAIAGAELVVLDQAAHLPNIEQAEVFNRTLGRFLVRCGVGAG